MGPRPRHARRAANTTGCFAVSEMRWEWMRLSYGKRSEHGLQTCGKRLLRTDPEARHIAVAESNNRSFLSGRMSDEHRG